MLVLTRQEGESITIGEGIVVRVVTLGPSQVRLGIEAPRDVLVLRSELVGDSADPPAGLAKP